MPHPKPRWAASLKCGTYYTPRGGMNKSRCFHWMGGKKQDLNRIFFYTRNKPFSFTWKCCFLNKYQHTTVKISWKSKLDIYIYLLYLPHALCFAAFRLTSRHKMWIRPFDGVERICWKMVCVKCWCSVWKSDPLHAVKLLYLYYIATI